MVKIDVHNYMVDQSNEVKKSLSGYIDSAKTEMHKAGFSPEEINKCLTVLRDKVIEAFDEGLKK